MSYPRQQSGSCLQECSAATSLTSSITVLFVNAQTLVGCAVTQLLASQPEVKRVDKSRNYIEARQSIDRLQPDIIWLDTHIGRSNDIEEIQQLKRLAPTAHIMVLTDVESEQEAFEVIMAGAQGYRSRQDIELGDIMTMIAMLCRGEFVLSTAQLSRLIKRLRDVALPLWDFANKLGTRAILRHAEQSDLAPLTTREREVLQLISRGCRDYDVARELGITEQTVQKHVQNILSKLGVQNRTQAAYLFYHRASL